MARNFQDNAVIDGGNNVGVSAGSPMAISCWTNFTSFVTNDTLVGKGFAASVTCYFLEQSSITQLQFGAFSNPNTFSTIATHGFSTGVWNHVYGDYTGSIWRLYLNGSLASSSGPVSGPQANSASFGIGALHITGAYSRNINAIMAEVAVWNISLPADVIVALAKGYSPAFFPKGCLVYAPLIGRSSPEIDRCGGRTLTVTNTVVAPHPRIIQPHRSRIRLPAVELFFMQPDADSSDGTWTDQDGGTSLFAAIDETTIDDADYIKSADTPVNDICKIRLSDPTVTPAQPFMVRYRYRKTGSAQIDLIVRLLEGTTEIAAWTHTDVADTFVTAEQTLSGGQFAAIGDFNNLFIEFNANAP